MDKTLIILIFLFLLMTTSFAYSETQDFKQDFKCKEQFGESFALHSVGFCEGLVCEENGECREVIYKLNEA